MRERRSDRFGNNRWLSDWVGQPVIAAPVTGLLPLWNETEIRLICDLPPGFIAGPWMTRSLRGAIGRTLRQWHEMQRPHGHAASAFEGLFQTHGTISGDHIPKPVSFLVAVVGNDLMVELRLFGRAAIWRDDLIEAAMVTLAQGIGLWENGKTLRPWPVRDWWWRETTGQHPPTPHDPLRLVWQTPFKPGGGATFAGDVRSALRSLPMRIKGLARWSGIDLTHDADKWQTLVDGLAMVDIGQGSSLDGFIRRDAGGDLAVVGVLGVQQLAVRDPELLAHLWLGQHIGIGGHRAYGFGRYRLG